TGQFCFAASAYSRNVASSIPGTRPCVASSTRVIAKPSPAFSRCTLAVVSIRSGWSPARDSPAESAIEKQPACAAASSSSGFVPCPSSKRDANEYGPSYAPLCIRILPCPSLNVPDHSAVADRTGIRSSPWCSRETFTCTSTRTAYENAGRRPRPSNRGTPAHGGAALVVHAHDVHGTGTHGPRPPGTRKKAGPHTGPAPVSPLPRPPSVQQRLDPLGEARARPVQPALHRPQVHARDLRDLLVALALQLPQLEHQTVVLRQLLDRLLDDLLEVPLPVQTVGSQRGVLELERPMLRLPVRRQLLEQHQRVPRAVPKLVLRQVRADRVDPGRELLRLVEPVQVPRHPDERLLHQVLRPIAITRLPRNELDQLVTVAVIQLRERARVTAQVRSHQLAVRRLRQLELRHLDVLRRPPLPLHGRRGH